MDNTDIAEYLEGGAAALASGELRWIRGSLGSSSDKTACAFGACNYAKFGSVTFGSKSAFDAYAVPVNLVIGRRTGMSLAEYNDSSRKKEEVIDTLTDLAKEFRNA